MHSSTEKLVPLVGRGGHVISESLDSSLNLFLRLLRKTLSEYGGNVLENFDKLRELTIKARNEADEAAFNKAKEFIASLNINDAIELSRAFSCYFHLANLAEENYRTRQISKRERNEAWIGEGSEIGEAFMQLVSEVGEEEALKHLEQLAFHPVLTAHPTEARRKAMSGKIRRISELLVDREFLGGLSLVENERQMLNEIDAMFRTSPIALKKPTPVDESDMVTSIFDDSLFESFILPVRRLDDFLQRNLASGETGYSKPIAPAFMKLGSWIGSDRDGNPNVTAQITLTVAKIYSAHILEKIAKKCHFVGRNLTLDTDTTEPDANLLKLVEDLSAEFSNDPELPGIYELSVKEPHRVALLLIAKKLRATSKAANQLSNNTASLKEYSTKYTTSQILENLRLVQNSLALAKANRSAYGPLQDLIWQVETFGTHLASMEIRQHSQVHEAAIEEIEKAGSADSPDLSERTKEVVATFRALAQIQRINGEAAANRYIVSFTQKATHIQDVFTLAKLSFETDKENLSHNPPIFDAIPLFETMDDLTNCVDILNEALKLPEIQNRLEQNGRKFEVMLGYSDSSKDVGPVAATFALHDAQERISKWAVENQIKLVLFHGRGGALGRGGGPAHRAVLAQPKGSVADYFKVTEQGETIQARYANKLIAVRHIEAVAAATLLNSAPSVEQSNENQTEKFAKLTQQLIDISKYAFHELVLQPDFPTWFAFVTPLEEVGLLPIGSRPAKRGLSVNSLEDLRAIPWVFAWSQARINLAAWFGFGTACEKIAENGGLQELKDAYRSWNLFTTLVDNIEMSVAKAETIIAQEYLKLGDGQVQNADEMKQRVLDELQLTIKWVLQISGSQYVLEKRRVLGQAVQIRGPYVDALSLLQVRSLERLRKETNLSEQDKSDLQHLLLLTVSGVAAGLQNTG